MSKKNYTLVTGNETNDELTTLLILEEDLAGKCGLIPVGFLREFCKRFEALERYYLWYNEEDNTYVVTLHNSNTWHWVVKDGIEDICSADLTWGWLEENEK